MTRLSIVVRTQFAGLHCWPEAPAQVAFLRSLHHHTFKVEATVQVFHRDRQAEFFAVTAELEDSCSKVAVALSETPSMSCEMMATSIYEQLCLRGFIVLKVVVSEDGLSDGVIERVD